MKELKDISKIGFGSYRVSINSTLHREALMHAIYSGCNLIDTAPNYSFGQSEELVGSVVSEIGKDVFIITKAGYIQGNDIDLVTQKNFDETLQIEDNFHYSIHPDFLNFQLTRSLKRLRRGFIDGFLLHNPEHYFRSGDPLLNKELIYKRVHKAFSFLEDMVSRGIIRYYGISSNSLPLGTDQPTTFSILKLFSLANEVSPNHHFKIIQFPFNIFEDNAVRTEHERGKTLIDLARELNIKLFSNRPLNAFKNDKMIRLATYDRDIENFDENSAITTLNAVLELISNKLKAEGESDWEEFPSLIHLKNYWNKMNDPDGVKIFFQGHLNPLIEALFEESLTLDAKNLLNQLREEMILCSKLKITINAKSIEKDLELTGVLQKNNAANSLPFRLCQLYNKLGIDHVLVGMRAKEYVEQFKLGF